MNTVLRFIKSILIICGYILISGCIQSLAILLNVKNDIFFTLLLILSAVLGTGYVVLLFHKGLREKFKELKAKYKEYIPIILKNWGIGLVIMCVLNLIINSLTNGLAPNEAANREVLGEYAVYSILYVAVLAPIAEEILFRLNFKDVFKNRKVFIIATALLFGGMHIVGNVHSWIDILYILPYSALGYFFSKTYVETDNIYASIIAHMIHNIFTLEIILLNL